MYCEGVVTAIIIRVHRTTYVCKVYLTFVCVLVGCGQGRCGDTEGLLCMGKTPAHYLASVLSKERGLLPFIVDEATHKPYCMHA